MILTENEQIALKLYKKKPGKIAAAEAGIEYKRLRQLIQVFGVKSEGHFWEPWQDKLLLELYGKVKVGQLAKEIKKTKWAIYHRNKLLMSK